MRRDGWRGWTAIVLDIAVALGPVRAAALSRKPAPAVACAIEEADRLSAEMVELYESGKLDAALSLAESQRRRPP